MKICIVGGVAGGAGAAAKLRRMDETAEIILFEKGDNISYANCGLPYYVGGEIRSREALLVTSPALLESRFNVRVRVNSEVVSIRKEEKVIRVKNTLTGAEYEESYDKLILSPGAAPKVFPIPGRELEGIFTVRTVPDAAAISRYLEEHQVSSALVVGGGFIGLEMAENLRKRGLQVTLAEFAGQVMAPLDPEMANILHQELIAKGVSLKLSRGITSFSRNGEELEATLSDGSKVNCGLAVLAMGVAPENKLAKEAGLELSVGGSIAADENFRTSDPDIYAVGDAISVTSGVTGEEILVPLAGPANRQGRSVARVIAGVPDSNGKKVYGSSVLHLFDYTAACTGMNEKQLKAKGISYQKTYVHPFSHANYYPGAQMMDLKLLFAPDGTVLGAQAVGKELVEKQIDVIAAVMKFRGTVYDLEELELCYAPPYNSAKSPVNLAGFTAANILRGEMPVIYAEDLPQLDREKTILLDVSFPSEFKAGTLPGAVNIPVDELRNRMEELDREKTVCVTCRIGLRGNVAARMLMQNGFRVYNLSGGFRTYCQANFDPEKAQAE